jgi:hypothetical protein
MGGRCRGAQTNWNEVKGALRARMHAARSGLCVARISSGGDVYFLLGLATPFQASVDLEIELSNE